MQKVYDEMSMSDEVRRAGGRVFAASTRAALRSVPLLFGLFLSPLLSFAVEWLSSTNDRIKLLGLNKMSGKLQISGSPYEGFLVSKVPVGYNKRSCIYLNGARTPCTWDTAAFRACVATRYPDLVDADVKARLTAAGKSTRQDIHLYPFGYGTTVADLILALTWAVYLALIRD